MKWMKCFSMAIMVAVAAFAIPVSAQIEMNHISIPPTIDGDLSEWEALFDSPLLTNPDFINPDSPNLGERAGTVPDEGDQKVEVWVGWNDRTDMIYVAGRVVDDVFGTNTTPDDPTVVWASDAMEVFINAINSGDGADRQQYVLNPVGAQGAVLFPLAFEDATLGANPPNVTAAAQRNGTVYTYEFAIPGWTVFNEVRHNFKRNQVIGFRIAFPDFDSEEDADKRNNHYYSTLGTLDNIWDSKDFKLIGKHTGLTVSANKAGGYRGGRFSRKPIVPGISSWGTIKILVQGGMEE